MRTLERFLKEDNPEWKAKERRVRCSEHIGNLAAEAFIKTACPSPTIFKKGRKAPRDDDSDSSDDSDPSSDSDDGLLEDFDPKDVLSKLLALITQVS